MKRNCDICEKQYNVKPSDLKRGWGLCCSKKCSAIKREHAKGNFGIKNILENNRRQLWKTENENDLYEDEPYMGLCDLT